MAPAAPASEIESLRAGRGRRPRRCGSWRPTAGHGEQPGDRHDDRHLDRPAETSSATAATIAAADGPPRRPEARPIGRTATSPGRPRPGRRRAVPPRWVVLSGLMPGHPAAGHRRARLPARGHAFPDDAGRLGTLGDSRLCAQPLGGLVVRRAASTRSATSSPATYAGSGPPPRTKRGLERADAPSVVGVVAGDPQPPGRGLGGGHRLAGMEVAARAARVLSGSGSSTSPMRRRRSRPPRAAAARRLRPARPGWSRAPWNSSPAVRSKGRSISTSASATRVAGPGRSRRRWWSRAGRW